MAALSGSPLPAVKMPASASQLNLSMLDTTDASFVKPDPEGAPACSSANTCTQVCVPATVHVRAAGCRSNSALTQALLRTPADNH